MTIQDYVAAHTARGECECGRCVDRGDRPNPPGHTVDTSFFKVAGVGEPDATAFTDLTRAHRGEFADVDLFDGREHSYIELGAWIGDQGLALQYMALGVLLDRFTLHTPKTLMPFLDEESQRLLAGQGYVFVKVKPVSVAQ